jgi:hypothetical protein
LNWILDGWLDVMDDKAEICVCGSCKKEVKEGGRGRAVRCDYCKIWFHNRCGDVNTQLYNALSDFNGDTSGTALHWYCRECCREVDVVMTERRKMKMGGGRGRTEGDVEGMRKDVEEIVERAVEKMLKAFATVQVKQGVLEEVVNTVRIELLEAAVRVESLGELARVTEERAGVLGKELAGVERDMSEAKESIRQVMEGGHLTVQAGDLGELRRAYVEVLSGAGEVEAEVEQWKDGSWQVRSREELGRSGEGMDLMFMRLGGEDAGELRAEVERMRDGKGQVWSKEEVERSGKRRSPVTMGMSEDLERQSRRLNLVFMGIKEVSVDEDKVVVQDLVRALMGSEQVGIRVGERVGRKGAKDRPIRVFVEEAEQRRRILARAKDLKRMEGKERIYIVPDLTRKQQEEDKILRDKVKAFRRAGQVGVKISKGEVVKGEGTNREVLYRLDS